MTFEDWFGSNRYLLKSEGKDRQIFTAEDLEDAWNAAIMEALRQVSLPCRSGDAGRDRLQDDLAKLLTA